MEKPHEIHWNAAKVVLRYLKGTLDYGIKYTDASHVNLTGYLDSDWAGILDDRRSTIVYAFNIGSGVVSWRNKKQPTVSLSSTEEEYKASCTTTCKVVCLRRLLQDVGEERKEPQSSIKVQSIL
jgi:outer membrane protein assembly factor BamB